MGCLRLWMEKQQLEKMGNTRTKLFNSDENILKLSSVAGYITL